MRNTIMLVTFLLILMLFQLGYAGFTGPMEVLTATYGSNNGQVGLLQGDGGDEFPWKFSVSPTGRIALCDEVNDRVVIYKSDGSFEKNINILSTGVIFDSQDSLYFKAKFRKFVKDGSMIFEHNVGYHEIYITLSDKIYGYDREQNKYFQYSSSGELLNSYSERPQELGIVKTHKLGDNNYLITVTYSDKVYGLTSDRKFSKFIQDNIGNIYGTNSGGVWRFNKCGKLEGKVLMPRTQKTEIPGAGAEEPYVSIQSKHGEPVVAANGDVYSWKKTAKRYSILKWTWADDPNVPTGPDAPTALTLMPSLSGIYMTWTVSPQDPGCVTGYEISRATTAGGVSSTIATVNAGVMGQTLGTLCLKWTKALDKPKAMKG